MSFNSFFNTKVELGFIDLVSHNEDSVIQQVTLRIQS